MNSDLLTLDGLAKSFGGTRALDGVGFSLAPGEVHALVGANGSGKSTLIKALAGVQPADAGVLVTPTATIRAPALDPEGARRAGILTVHQEAAVFGDLTVAENLALGTGFAGSSRAWIRWPAVRAHAREVIERFGLGVAEDTPAGELRPALRSMLAIVRVLAAAEGRGGVLVLDEPTALLPLHDVTLLHDHLREEAARGRAILYVSHRLDEVLALSDRITVLRDGRRIRTFTRDECSQAALAGAMFGPTAAAHRAPRRPRPAKAPALSIAGLAGGGLHGVDLEVRPGEVVGVVGLAGSGVDDLLSVVFGARDGTGGEVRIDGELLRRRSPGTARAAGMARIAGDLSAAVFPGLSVAENLAIADLGAHRRRGHLSSRSIRRSARAALVEHGVKGPGADAPISTLSGGNQQKVVFARWLRRRPRVLLLEDPTAGVDVAARAGIYELLDDAVAGGAGVLVTSSDVEELALVCDRVVLLRDGRVAGHAAGALSGARLTALVYDQGGPA